MLASLIIRTTWLSAAANQQNPSFKDIMITVLGYALALAVVAGVFYFIYRFYYKKEREKDPRNKLGKF